MASAALISQNPEAERAAHLRAPVAWAIDVSSVCFVMAYHKLLFILLCLTGSQLVQGTLANSTSPSPSCPPPDDNTRSVWGIVWSCVLTLFICVWHTVHPDVPGDQERYKQFFVRAPWVFIASFVAPEAVVSSASKEWCEVRQKVRDFRLQGYEWSMSHGHFVEMGGFVYHDDKGSQTCGTITSFEFLQLCEKGKIGNPLITERQIRDSSKSDARGKAIFIIQLFWFVLQVIVRGYKGLAITLIELDTVCMSTLALLYLLFWWDKPLRPECPHVFYPSREVKIYSKEELSRAWKKEPSYWYELVAFIRRKFSLAASEEKPSPPHQPGVLLAMIEKINPVNVQLSALYMTWIILGGLHLIAWNWHFPSETERIIWRIASLVLAASPLAMTIVARLETCGVSSDAPTYALGTLGIISRLLLVGLMLASLRALPCSAYQTVSWTSYIPHL